MFLRTVHSLYSETEKHSLRRRAAPYRQKVVIGLTGRSKSDQLASLVWLLISICAYNEMEAALSLCEPNRLDPAATSVLYEYPSIQGQPAARRVTQNHKAQIAPAAFVVCGRANQLLMIYRVSAGCTLFHLIVSVCGILNILSCRLVLR